MTAASEKTTTTATAAKSTATMPKFVLANHGNPGTAVATSVQWQWFLGAFCLGLFVVSWVTSLASPFVLGLALYFQIWTVAGVILSLVVLAYIPWYPPGDPHPLKQAFQQFCVYSTSYYFRSVRVFFEGQDVPKANNEPSQERQQQQRSLTTKTDSKSDKNSNAKNDTPNTNDNTKPTLLLVHPHGVFSFGWSMLVLRLHDVHFCFAHSLYMSPFFRLFSRLTGNPASANKPAMQAAMRQGKHLALIPGGLEEATITTTSAERVYIQKRMGFVKLSLQHGYQLRPVYSFNEINTFRNLQGMFPLRLLMNRYGIPGVIPFGWFPVPCLPRPNVDLMVVVGPPLELPKIPDPTPEDVQTWHAKYVEALQELFERNKVAAYGAEVAKTKKLELW
ncbi:hypothetical protein ACA910_001812 [Epithemia clementina (nom. ined.)]